MLGKVLPQLTNGDAKEDGVDNKHLVVETEDTEGRDDATERHRRAPQIQSIDALAV